MMHFASSVHFLFSFPDYTTPGDYRGVVLINANPHSQRSSPCICGMDSEAPAPPPQSGVTNVTNYISQLRGQLRKLETCCQILQRNKQPGV